MSIHNNSRSCVESPNVLESLQNTALRSAIILAILILICTHQAFAIDEQTLIGEGDNQTCIGGELGCAALDGMTTSIENSTMSLNGSISIEYTTYTTNEIIRLAQAGSMIQNNGTANATGKIIMTVEKNITGTYTTVATVINDTSANRTIAASETIDIAAIWNTPGWNTTLAGIGDYRIRLRFDNESGSTLIDITTPFIIVDNLMIVNITTDTNNAFTNSTINISFNVTTYRTINTCYALLDGAQAISTTTVAQINTTATGSSIISQLQGKTSTIAIICNDTTGTTANTSTQVTVVQTTTFSGNTTNLNIVNLSSIPNLTLQKPSAGQIRFAQNINLSGGANLDQYITIAPRSISINSAALPALNKSATITFYDITDITYPIIFRDGAYCQDCVVNSFTGGVFTVSVTHFSTYTVGTNAQLVTADTTDTQLRGPSQDVQVSANYTNSTSSAAITGATCQVTFSDTGAQAMAYDAGLLMYTMNRTFNSSGIYPYTVQCGAVGFETLNGTDHVGISGANQPVSPVAINVTESTRGDVSNPPAPIDAQGGNASEVNMDSIQITSTWQGVYGNLSGETRLSTETDAIFYNWSLKNFTGEVYASRAQDVNFASIGCGQNTHLTQEDAFLGSTGASDAVNRTFTQTNHPAFAIGNVNQSSNSCPSTNMRTPGGQDLSKYYQVLLVDGANNTVYTALLQQNTTGFNGKQNDFQMLIPTRHDALETYFYWIEIN